MYLENDSQYHVNLQRREAHRTMHELIRQHQNDQQKRLLQP